MKVIYRVDFTDLNKCGEFPDLLNENGKMKVIGFGFLGQILSNLHNPTFSEKLTKNNRDKGSHSMKVTGKKTW